jgi:hypothetical protein
MYISYYFVCFSHLVDQFRLSFFALFNRMAIPFWTLGLTIMPAYLDHKMNTLPETLPDGYYGGVSAEEEEDKAAVGVEAPLEDVEAKA